MELLYGDRWQEFEPLDDAERPDILRTAIGYALGEDALGLGRFRERYAGKMGDGLDRRAFDVVTAPVGSGGVEFGDIARALASVDTLDGFLRDMRAVPGGTAAHHPEDRSGEHPEDRSGDHRNRAPIAGARARPPHRGGALASTHRAACVGFLLWGNVLP
jgi:hypothetical protein